MNTNCAGKIGACVLRAFQFYFVILLRTFGPPDFLSEILQRGYRILATRSSFSQLGYAFKLYKLTMSL